MRTKEEHKEYMRQWRKRRKPALDPQNSPELPVLVPVVPSRSVTTMKSYQTLSQDCDISPTKRFVNIYLYHPQKKGRLHFTEVSGKTLTSLKSQGFEIEKKNLTY